MPAGSVPTGVSVAAASLDEPSSVAAASPAANMPAASISPTRPMPVGPLSAPMRTMVGSAPSLEEFIPLPAFTVADDPAPALPPQPVSPSPASTLAAPITNARRFICSSFHTRLRHWAPAQSSHKRTRRNPVPACHVKQGNRVSAFHFWVPRAMPRCRRPLRGRAWPSLRGRNGAAPPRARRAARPGSRRSRP